MDLQKLEQIKALRAKYRVGDSNEKAFGTGLAAGIGASYLAGKFAAPLIHKIGKHAGEVYRDLKEQVGKGGRVERSINEGKPLNEIPHSDPNIPTKVRGHRVPDVPPLLTPRKDKVTPGAKFTPVPKFKPGREPVIPKAPKNDKPVPLRDAMSYEDPGETNRLSGLTAKYKPGSRGQREGDYLNAAKQAQMERRSDRGDAEPGKNFKDKPYSLRGQASRNVRGRELGHPSPNVKPQIAHPDRDLKRSSRPNVKPTAADFTSSADKPVDIPEKLDVHSEHRGGDVTRSGGEIHRLESAPKESTYQAPPPVRRETKDPLQNLTSPHHRRDREVVPYVSPKGSPSSSTRSTQPAPVQKGQEESGPVLEGEQTEGTKKSAKTRGKGKKVNTPESDAYNKLHTRGHVEAVERGSYTAPYKVLPVENEEYFKRKEKPETPSPVYHGEIPGLVVPKEDAPSKEWRAYHKQVAAWNKKKRNEKKKSFGDVEEKAMDIDTKAAKKKPLPKELQGLPRSAVATTGKVDESGKVIPSRPLTRAEQKLVRGPARTTGSTKREIPRGSTNLGPMARRVEETPEQIAAINAANAEIEGKSRKAPAHPKKIAPGAMGPERIYDSPYPKAESQRSRYAKPNISKKRQKERDIPFPVSSTSASYAAYVPKTAPTEYGTHRGHQGAVSEVGQFHPEGQSRNRNPQLRRGGEAQPVLPYGPASISRSHAREVNKRASEGGLTQAQRLRGVEKPYVELGQGIPRPMSISRSHAHNINQLATRQQGESEQEKASRAAMQSTARKIAEASMQQHRPTRLTTNVGGTPLISRQTGYQPSQSFTHSKAGKSTSEGYNAARERMRERTGKSMTIQNRADSFADRIGLVKAARPVVGPKMPPHIAKRRAAEAAGGYVIGGATAQEPVGRNVGRAKYQRKIGMAPDSGGVSGAYYGAPQERIARRDQELVHRGGQELVGRGGAARPMRSVGQERIYPNFAGTQISREQARRMGHADITHTSGKHLGDDQTRAEKFMGRLARKNQDKSNNPGSLGVAGGLESMAALI